jgi:hypothetical protein
VTTVEELIDKFGMTARGQAFLINLYHTLERGFIMPLQVKTVCEEFISMLSVGGYSLPSVNEMVELLGKTCVAEGLWQHGPEPILEKHLPKREFILSRITSYHGFYRSILRRASGLPPIRNMPEPIKLSASNHDEIAPSNVIKVRRMINTGKWKALILGHVNMNVHCIWMTSLSKLRKRVAFVPDPADIHRDIVGLSHFCKGCHLIRLDFDLEQWPQWKVTMRRRPHGAGNGGSRFRVKYDGRESMCRWGRTVDLARVATNNMRTLNGIPELLLQGFSIPKTAIDATYLGPLLHPPENNDVFFFERLRRNHTIANIIATLKSDLT